MQWGKYLISQECLLLYIYICAQSLSHVFVTPRTVARLVSLSLGILQARIPEWVAMPFSRGSSQARDWTHVSHIVGRLLSVWATREVQQLLGLGPNLSPRGVTASLIKGTWDRTGKPGPRPAGRCSEDVPPSNYFFFFNFILFLNFT